MIREFIALVQQRSYWLSRVVVFGAHAEGRDLTRRLRASGFEVLYICDRDNHAPHGSQVEGVEVVPVGRLREQPSPPVILASNPGAWFSALQLRAMGVAYFTEQELQWTLDITKAYANALPRLVEVFKLLDDDASRRTMVDVLKFRLTMNVPELRVSPYPQYFHPLVSPRPGDVVLDVGAYDGTVAGRFADAAGETGRVYCFEPSPENFKKLQATAGRYPRPAQIEAVEAGAWESDGQMTFAARGGGSPADCIYPGGGLTVRVVSLDSFCRARNIRPTMIKMDIEGAEMKALQGAREIIRECKPRLAICVYHKWEDIWEIPPWIKSLNPDYRLHLGLHLPDSASDSVLYAG